jgi:hypothetical protein
MHMADIIWAFGVHGDICLYDVDELKIMYIYWKYLTCAVLADLKAYLQSAAVTWNNLMST